ncbi:hypothetical protein WJX72_006465 [[Myrmecia] bisecta]|uniref:RED-like N-terminal domain-containing protein n=1 Tax=[Myrmecia] bisecta TaxID=41462 RepID=A0AAW1PQC0_9CHLO
MEDYANPLPPPPKPEGSLPKSNADFRKLLDEPRAKPAAAAAGEHAGKQRPAAKKTRRPKPEPAADRQKEDESGYRDRAAERRKGVNPDYERVNADLASTGQHVASLEAISMEESKFLGGDLDHTHLVKGLDFALLQKVRGELKTDDAAEKEAKAKVKAAKQKQELKFITPQGRALYNALFNPSKLDVSEMFLARRTAFVFDLEGEFGDTDIPTTLRRSKADCPPVQECLAGAVDSQVLERMAKIMSYMRVSAGGKSGKRLKKKEKLQMLSGLATNGTATPITRASMPGGATERDTMSPKGPRPAADGGEDIFGGAGSDYVCELPPKQNGAAAAADGAGAAAKAGSAYFDKKDDMRDLPALPSQAAAGRDDGDMDIDVEEDEEGVLPGPPPGPPGAPPPPPPPPPTEAPAGPARPPPGFDYSSAYGPSFDNQQWGGGQPYADPDQYEAYVQANVAYQANTDPEYQALMAKQQALREEGAAGSITAEAQAAGGLTQQQKEAGMASVFKRDDERLAARREADAREKDPAFVSDAYAECYPGYHEYATAVVDSDDENFNDMDSKEKGKSRYDFDTEEQWQAYKGSKEAAPKAAFQFGIKMSDGRKAHKNLGKAKDQKLNSELSKIQGILEKQGGDYSKAFEKPPALEEERAAPHAASKKRMRLG